MSKYAVMPITDYENICNAVREKTGKTDLLKSGDISGEIGGIEVGGDIDGLNAGTITEVSTNLTNLREYAFAKCPQLIKASIPNVTFLPSHVLRDNPNLKTVEMPNATQMAYACFYGCTKLELMEMPSGLTAIKGMTFMNCKGLKNITFKSKLTTIDSDVFSGCTNLLTINVPWGEGEVANSPWGATNATINYNFTGD